MLEVERIFGKMMKGFLISSITCIVLWVLAVDRSRDTVYMYLTPR
jgi:hypothetical protein